MSANCTSPSPTLYELPLADATVGTLNINNYTDIFQSCARPAKVRTYHDDCGLYAPALNQAVQELVDCLYDGGIRWEDVWYSSESEKGVNASATGEGYPTASATVKPSSISEGKDGDEGEEEDTDTNDAVRAGDRSGMTGFLVFGLLASGLVR